MLNCGALNRQQVFGTLDVSVCNAASLTVLGLEFAHSSAACFPGSIISLRNQITRGYSLNMFTWCWPRSGKSPTSSSGTSVNGAVIEALRRGFNGAGGWGGGGGTRDVSASREDDDEDAARVCLQTDRLSDCLCCRGSGENMRHCQGGRRTRSTSALDFPNKTPTEQRCVKYIDIDIHISAY